MSEIYQRYNPEGWLDSKQDVFSLEDINRAYKTGEVLQGFVNECDNNFNLHVSIGDFKGIIPKNELEGINVQDDGSINTSIYYNKVNSFIQFRVKEIKDGNNFIFSRKKVQEEALEWATSELKPGMVVNGIVKNMRKYGVFVEIGGGVVGLLHIEDISVSRIKDPEERFSVGQKINVMIKSIDKENGKIVLSYKELLGDWDENVKDYSEKTVVQGIVKEVDKYKNGIFVELKPNLVGLAEYKEGLNYGQTVDVYIKKIIKERKKIKLLIV